MDFTAHPVTSSPDMGFAVYDSYDSSVQCRYVKDDLYLGCYFRSKQGITTNKNMAERVLCVYRLSWSKRDQRLACEASAKGEDVRISLLGIRELADYDAMNELAREKVRNAIIARWQGDIDDIKTALAQRQRETIWAGKNKQNQLIPSQASSLKGITVTTHVLDEEQTEVVTLVRRSLKRGYSALMMLQRLLPFLSAAHAMALRDLMSAMEKELLMLDDVAELFCFKVVSKQKGKSVDDETLYSRQQYRLSFGGKCGRFASSMMASVWKYLPDVSEVIGVAYEYASSSQGNEGNTNSANFEALQHFIASGQKPGSDPGVDQAFSYTSTHDTLEAEYAKSADGMLLMSSATALLKQGKAPEWMKKITQAFNLAEQLKMIALSDKCCAILSNLPHYEQTAKHIGLYIQQARVHINKAATDVDATSLGSERLKQEWEGLAQDWQKMAQCYVKELLSDGVLLKTLYTRKGRWIERRRINLTRDDTLGPDIIAFERDALRKLQQCLKVKCYTQAGETENRAQVSANRLNRMMRRA